MFRERERAFWVLTIRAFTIIWLASFFEAGCLPSISASLSPCCNTSEEILPGSTRETITAPPNSVIPRPTFFRRRSCNDTFWSSVFHWRAANIFIVIKFSISVQHFRKITYLENYFPHYYSFALTRKHFPFAPQIWEMGQWTAVPFIEILPAFCHVTIFVHVMFQNLKPNEQ